MPDDQPQPETETMSEQDLMDELARLTIVAAPLLAQRDQETRQSIIAMIEREAARRGRAVQRLADILTGAIANRFDEEDTRP